MSKMFRHTLWISVLLASGAVVTACHSEKDRSEKKASSGKPVEDAPAPKVEPAPAESPSVIERIFSPSSSKPATPKHSASTKSTHSKPTHTKQGTHSKGKAHADAKMATKSSTKKSFTGSSTYTSYGEGAEGAGITDPNDTKQTIKGTTSSGK